MDELDQMLLSGYSQDKLLLPVDGIGKDALRSRLNLQMDKTSMVIVPSLHEHD